MALGSLLLFAFENHIALGTQEQPNIILILSDDQGYGDLGCYGNDFVQTPNLDRLSEQSVFFRNFHSQPVCSPTRAELMTGRRFLETGVWGVHGGRDYLNLNEKTIAEYLGEAGYRSAMLGKWHLGKTAAYLPYNRGFDESWSIIDRLYQHTHPVFDHNGKREQIGGWTPEVITDLGVKFIERNRERPFFLYMAYPEVHEPWIAPPDIVQKYVSKGLSKSLATVLAMNEQLDASVGRVLNKLDELALEKNSIVIYVGDNGPIHQTSNGLEPLTDQEMEKRNPKGLRGSKGNLYENGTRVPGLLRWSGRWAPREVVESADVIDIVPTLLELAGLEVSNEMELRGRSLLPLVRGDMQAEDEQPVVYGNHETIWPGRTRLYSHLDDRSLIDLNRSHLSLRKGKHKIVQGWSGRELFNLESDPQEQHDIREKHPKLFERLSRQLDERFQEIYDSPHSYRSPVFPVGFRQEKSSYLFACAASKVFGNVETESHSVDHWRQDGDGLQMRIRVDTPAEYEVAVDLKGAQPQGKIEVRIAKQEISSPLNSESPLRIGKCKLSGSEQLIEVRLRTESSADQDIVERFEGIYLTRLEN